VAVALLGRRFQMERLVRFNEKFSPEWRPRYLIYESRFGLPRAILRVLEVEGYVGQRGGSRSIDDHHPAPLSLPRAERSGLGEVP
jgi:hypothetical protein